MKPISRCWKPLPCLLGAVFLFTACVSPKDGQQMDPMSSQSQEQSAQTDPLMFLDQELMAQIRAGEPGGLVKIARSNGFPGPSEVLAASTSLDLNATQLNKASEWAQSTRQKARELGQRLLIKEKYLAKQFADGKPDPRMIERLSMEIARIQGMIRALHLKSHIEMRGILDQKQLTRLYPKQ